MRNNKTICLSLVVKNQSASIETCLQSVRELIDTWVIIDFGSEDGTRTVIHEVLKGIPGELYDREYGEGTTLKNEAFSLAKDKAD